MNGKIRIFISLVFLVLMNYSAISQTTNTKKPEKKYPSLLWEITGNGLKKPSYLFGTMHVSSKMVFHLSDSFFIGIKNADVVGLELNSETWQDEMVDVERQKKIFNSFYGGLSNYKYYNYYNVDSYDKRIRNSSRIDDKTYDVEVDYLDEFKYALKETPFIVNSLLYRNREYTQDFEENTFLDMYIYQTGKKLGKKSAGMETIYTMEKYVTEAEIARAKEKKKNTNKDRSKDDIPDMSSDEAYRKGDLDMLDSIDRIYYNTSPAFTEKFLYQRNEVQAMSMDTIMKKGLSLFVGVGAAHLPGKRGVIEILRRMGYKLRPIKMIDRDASVREKIDKIRVPVQFIENKTDDGFISVKVPGRMYNRRTDGRDGADLQYCDMSNGTYYMLTRISTSTFYYNEPSARTMKKIDSVLYENIPGKILSKKKISKQGYDGYDITNRTRKGDVQRYNIFVTPFEIIIFKMSGVENYVQLGTEANTFFNSISFNTGDKNSYSQLKVNNINIHLPNHRNVYNDAEVAFIQAYDEPNKLQYVVYKSAKENVIAFPSDAFVMDLQEKSLLNPYKKYEVISRKVERKNNLQQMVASYKFKDSFLCAKFIIDGEAAYMAAVKGPNKDAVVNNKSVLSLSLHNMVSQPSITYIDTFLNFKVKTPFYPQVTDSLKSLWHKASENNSYNSYYSNSDDEYQYEKYGTSKQMYFTNKENGETIKVIFSKEAKYNYTADSLLFYKNFRDSMEKVLNNPERLAYVVDSLYTVRGRGDYLNYYKKYKVTKKLYRNAQGFSVEEEIVYDTATSLKTWEKSFTKEDLNYRISSTISTSGTSSFVNDFFNSFEPLYDRLKTVPYYGSKVDSFFADYYSKDTATFKVARNAVTAVKFEKKDIPRMIKAYQSLTLKDKDYFEMKTKWISAIANIGDSTAAPTVIKFLQSVYDNAGDTALLQNKALQGLRDLKTKQAMLAFKNYIIQDPPLKADNDYGYRYGSYYDYDYDSDIIDNIFDIDSLELAKLLFPEVLQLASIDDYKKDVLLLLKKLVDSNKLSTKDYESYLSKLMFDAKIALKRKQLAEQNKIIEKHDDDPEDADDDVEETAVSSDEPYYYGSSERGDELEDLIALMLPFYEKNTSIPQFINKVFALKDDKLKYRLMHMMLKANKPIPDTLVSYFAKREVDRGALYYSLSKLKKQHLFPKNYLKQEDMARAFLYTDIGKMDRVDSMQKIFLINLYRMDSTTAAQIFDSKSNAPAPYAFDYDGPYWSDDYESAANPFVYGHYYNNADRIASEKLDTIVLIRKELTTINLSTGYLYIYKYKQKKADKWRLAFSGLHPADGSISIHNSVTQLTDEKITDDEPLEDLIQKQLKRIKADMHPWSRGFYTEKYDYRRSYYYDY